MEIEDILQNIVSDNILNQCYVIKPFLLFEITTHILSHVTN